ncbi:sugar ABC transporter permease [Streptomyces sp. PTM05]|uniref:Sugar ABC transporter permease n=1 Tax=Streptantibioticus parmotrematis TaxID=2873249 RepID=A0ABS7QWH5_9ACTN|nr:sugar ABC transporter permease [Streptantibioticus parmotrematis]MBY8886124.1 sugar ABC transporter permease [Streptantibioticus parmotrematis]
MNARADQGRWADAALTAVLERAGATAEEVGDRFPLYAGPGGPWTTTARGSWTGGCWAGLLWLRALATGAREDEARARACTGRLEAWVDEDTATRGLIFWYGTALGADVAGDPGSAALRERAARACLAAYDEGAGVVPWGAAFGGERLLARADSVPGLVPLLSSTEDGARAALAHLRTHLRLCGAADPAPPQPAWRRAGEGWRPCAVPPQGWSRTEGWLLLGAADASHHVPDAADDATWAAVERFAGRRLAHGAPLVPRDAGGPPDTSAAAIEAVAALKLARLRGETWLLRRADAALRELTLRHVDDRAALLDGCYDTHAGIATRHELIWGDFFLALGLAVLTGLVDPFAT